MQCKFYFILIFSIVVLACNTSIPSEDAVEIGTTDCRKQPAFFSKSGFDLKRSALSTSEKRATGMFLVEIPSDQNTVPRKWQHPSWARYGFMGPITTDDEGNTFVAPVPSVNVLENKPENQNTIYKVESNSGEMSPWLVLPAENTNNSNVFGILGLQYDCHTGFLLATSVASSSRELTKGLIYILDTKNKKIIDKLEGFDAIGVGVCGISGTKRIYFGLARKSEIWSVEMDKNGKFKGTAQKEISLDMLGPRGDDKARKIRFDAQGNMIVYGVEFNFNLTAPTEKQETMYSFSWNSEDQKWIQIK